LFSIKHFLEVNNEVILLSNGWIEGYNILFYFIFGANERRFIARKRETTPHRITPGKIQHIT
jgi:hypothetical protein